VVKATKLVIVKLENVVRGLDVAVTKMEQNVILDVIMVMIIKIAQ
jgi:hypothetical protein